MVKNKSVWDALEANPTQANLKLRSRLMMEISEFVKTQKLTKQKRLKGWEQLNQD